MTTPTVNYSGRFTTDGRFAWPATAIATRFVGSAISILLSGGPASFVATIDGVKGEPFTCSGAIAHYLLADNLGPGSHTVTVTRRSESQWGVTQFHGFQVTDGRFDPQPTQYSHRLLVLGDSISCGYGAGGVNGTCHLDLMTEDVTIAYPTLLAQLLNADLQDIAYEGRGMYIGVPPDAPSIPVIFDRVLADDDTSVWDQSSYVPDVVVINLGTNDESDGDPGQPFVDAYVAFLQRLRGLFPAAKIFATLGPMSPFQYMFDHVQAAVTAVADPHVYYIPVDQIDSADGAGCDNHPNAITHRKMANQLYAEIEALR